MPRQAIIGALLLVGVGVVLGTTVFRADIAQATGLAQSVTVDNTTTNPVPVREQNLDSGNIKVHEQGTAAVDVRQSEVTGALTVDADSHTESSGHAYDVPAGKQLIIEYLAGRVCCPSAPHKVSGRFLDCAPGCGAELPVVFEDQGAIASGFQQSAGSEAVHYALAPGHTLLFKGVNESDYSVQFFMTLGGHLEPAS